MGTEKEKVTASATSIRVLAVASGGGHWLELLRLRPALEGCEQYFIGIDPSLESTVTPHSFYAVCDAHFDEPWKMICMSFRLLRLFLKIRPQVVISTGSASGVISMLLGRIFRARTLWVDSVANCHVLSRSGRIALRLAHKMLTQCPHMARPEGPFYRGSVLP